MKHFRVAVFVTLGLALLLPMAGSGRAELFKNPGRAQKITQRVAQSLERFHYIQQPVDEETSRRHLRSYLDALDYNHLIFFTSDIAEFEARFGATISLDALRGDVEPAEQIFQRFLVRLTEKEQLVDRLIGQSYDFNTPERFYWDRDKAPWPNDFAESERLWKSRIKFELIQGRLDKEKPEETVKKITKRYRNFFKTMRELEPEEVLSVYLSALAHAYDPHSDYLSPEEAKNFEINVIDLKLSGIGAVLRSEDGYATIEKLVPGGPADLSKKLHPDDRLLSVGQGERGEWVDVIDMKLNKVVELIRGPRGSRVRLLVAPTGQPDSAKREVTIVRDEVKLTEQKASAEILERKGADRRVGVLRLPQFYKGATLDCARLITALKAHRVAGIILDLRKNGGGLLEEAIDLTGLFIARGPVVQVRTAGGRTEVLSDQDDGLVLYPGPLVVLVGHLSASASEIVAGALQDYGRAVIIGDRSTHGKGTVQTWTALDRGPFGLDGDLGRLKLTVQKFYRIAGGSTQVRGVIPEIQLPSLYDHLDIGESKLPNALPYDEVAPAQFETMNLAAPYLPQLKQQSQTRIARDPEFRYLLEDVAKLEERQKNKWVSLNESERIQERDVQEARTQSRKKERDALRAQDPGQRVWELTLEQLDQHQPPVERIRKTSPENVSESAVAKRKKNAASPGADLDLDEDSGFSWIDPQRDEAGSILLDYANALGRGKPDIGQ